MTPKPLLLADAFLVTLAADAKTPIAVLGMHDDVEAKLPPSPRIEIVSRRDAMLGLRQGRFSRLVMSPRRGGYLDPQRPFFSRLWQGRKNIGNEALRRQYAVTNLALSLGVPLAVVDLTDTFHIAEWDHPLLQKCRAFWMREYPLHPLQMLFNTSRRMRRYSSLDAQPLVREMSKVRPISLGFSDAKLDLIEPAAKKVDVFYSAAPTNPLRTEALRTLQKLQAEGEFRIHLPAQRLSPAEFYRACAEAHLVVSPSGWGWDCYRHYEAAACRSVPVMNYPSIRRHRPFVEGEHALYYDPDGGLEPCLREALRDRARLVEMGEWARRHVLEFHLHSHLLQLVLESC